MHPTVLFSQQAVSGIHSPVGISDYPVALFELPVRQDDYKKYQDNRFFMQEAFEKRNGGLPGQQEAEIKLHETR